MNIACDNDDFERSILCLPGGPRFLLYSGQSYSIADAVAYNGLSALKDNAFGKYAVSR